MTFISRRDLLKSAIAAGAIARVADGLASQSAPLKTLTGTVKAEGDKVTFVDKSGKSWDVMNPEELKAHDGHHVQVSAHVYADKSAIHVVSVKMQKGDKSAEPTSKY